MRNNVLDSEISNELKNYSIDKYVWKFLSLNVYSRLTTDIETNLLLFNIKCYIIDIQYLKSVNITLKTKRFYFSFWIKIKSNYFSTRLINTLGIIRILFTT